MTRTPARRKQPTSWSIVSNRRTQNLRKIGAASQALASAKLLMKSAASLLHLPPVSMATTTSRHLSLTRSS